MEKILVANLGEFGLIERFRKQIRTDPSVIKGSGDDCAVIKFSPDKYLLFTCDMIVEKVDFLAQDKPELIGRKALSLSISDIAACGGIPRYCLISMGLPKNTALKEVDGIYRGIKKLAQKFKINLVGGDLSRSGRITIDVSMLGLVEKKYLVLRSGAKKGDIIFVTGSLGGSMLGKHLKFMPRLKEARLLVENFKINSMIDISDGLIQDLGHILKQSQAGAIIYENLIPLSNQAKDLNDAFYGGEDFELLFTLPRNQAGRLSRKRWPGFKPIGEIVNKKYGLRLIDKKGREKVLCAKGFTHF